MIIRNSMKAMVAALGVTAMVAGASVAQAAVAFDPDGVGGVGTINNVSAFDWSPGNLLSVGGQSAVNLLASQQPALNTPSLVVFQNTDPGNTDYHFTSYYQAKLANLLLTGGGSVAPVGWEITVVAKVKESVSSIIIDNIQNKATASFDVVQDAGNYIEIYAHKIGDAGTAVASDLDGTGFNDGKLILSGLIVGGDSGFTRNTAAADTNLDAFGSDEYAGQQSVVSGSPSNITLQPFDIDVTSIDNDFFKSILAGFSLDFIATSQLAFNSADPSARFLINSGLTASGASAEFAGAGAPGDAIYGIGTVNGVDGNSFQFLADGNSALNGSTPVVPEPATAAMGLLGLVGLAAAARRRRNA